MTEQRIQPRALRCALQFTLQNGVDEATGDRFTAVAEARELFSKSLREWLKEYYEDKFAMGVKKGYNLIPYKFTRVIRSTGVVVDLNLRGEEVKLYQVLREDDALLVTVEVAYAPATRPKRTTEDTNFLQSQKHMKWDTDK